MLLRWAGGLGASFRTRDLPAKSWKGILRVSSLGAQPGNGPPLAQSKHGERKGLVVFSQHIPDRHSSCFSRVGSRSASHPLAKICLFEQVKMPVPGIRRKALRNVGA